MTDMITVSRKEIEALQRWQDDEEIANNCYEDDDGCFILYDDLRALLDKAEVVSGEAVGEIKIYWGSDTGYEYGLTLIGGALGSQKEYDEWIVKNFNGEGVFKLYTTPQPSRIAELEAEIQRLNAIIAENEIDAKRYRWLKCETYNQEIVICRWNKNGCTEMFVDAIDEAIDEAMTKEK